MSGPLDLSARPRLALGGAVTVVAVVVGVVLAFGLVPYPALPTVADQPAPRLTVRLALVDHGPDGSCLQVADAEGARRTVDCGPGVEGFDLRWLDEDEVALTSGFDGRQRTAVDVTTGATRPLPDADATPEDRRTGSDPRYGTLTTGRDGDMAVLEVRRPDGTEATLLQLQGPERYDLYQPMWSEDGRWVVVQDSAQRVIVLPAAGGQARIWLDDVTGEVAIR